MSLLSTRPAAERSAPNAELSDRGDTTTTADYLVFTLIGTLLFFSLDTEVVSVIPLLKRIELTYHMSAIQGGWALSATGIAAGAMIPLLSRLGDIFGLRRLLLVTLFIAAIGNVICAVANGPATFIIGRAVIGINAGLPLYYAILRARSHSKKVTDRYAGLMTLAIGASVCVSFFYGGVIIQAGGSVRLAMWIIAAVSLVLVGIVRWGVDEVPIRVPVGVDYLGALLVGTAFAALVTGISQANSWGWGSAKVLGLIALSAVLFLAWGSWELRCDHPLIDLRVIRRRAIWPGLIIAALATVIGVNGLLVITNYVQTPSIVGYGFGSSVLVTACYLLPAGVFIAFGGSLMAPFIERIGQRNAVLVGGGLTLVLFLVFSQLSSTPVEFLVMSAVLGLCYALILTSGVTIYLRAARPGEQGMFTGSARATASGVGAIGPAIITTLLTASLIPKIKVPVPQSGNYTHVWLVWAGLGAVVILAGLFVKETQLDDRPTADAQLID